MMPDDPSEIRARAQRVRSAGPRLRTTPVRDRARWLAAAAESLEPHEPLGVLACRELPRETGLSEAMVHWALDTTLHTVTMDAMLELAEAAMRAGGASQEPVSLVSVVLAGNVFTAPLRGIFVPLLLGAPVLVKASSNEARFPRLMRRALAHADPSLAEAISIVSFKGGSPEHEAALFDSAETISIFGSDETVAAVEARVERRDSVLAHGHGISVAYCSTESQRPDRVADTTAALARDIAAYDQRGCLSPQFVYVQCDDSRTAGVFATRLSQALDDLGQTLPRGPLPDWAAVAQTQWRGLAEVEGRLVRGRQHAVSVVSGEARSSPGYRNVSVSPVADVKAATQSMRSLGAHLKCIGCDRESRARIATALAQEPGVTAYTTALGTMQTPAFDAPADGRPAWWGYVKRR